MRLNYFAFGSNLSSPRLRQRLPSVSVAGVATLAAHRLCWRKNDRGQSGKCDIDYTGEHAHRVYGVIYHMTAEDRHVLDRIEGNGYGYARKSIEVVSLAGEMIPAFTYYALDIDHMQQPFHWYKEHVLRGALEHGFPEHYVAEIRDTLSIDDHDHERHARELAIYGIDR